MERVSSANDQINNNRDYDNAKRFFHKLFSIISSVIILLIILTTIILSIVFNDYAVQYVKDSNQKMLSQISYHFEYMNKFINSFIQNIYDNPTTASLLYSKANDIFDMIEKVDLLDAYRNNSIFIHSFYFYNSKHDYFLCIGEANVLRDTEDMFDQDIIDTLNNHKPYAPIKPIARLIPNSAFDQNTKARVYTFILGSFSFANNELNDAVIVNIDANWLLHNIQAMTLDQLDKNDTFILADGEGHVLGHSDQDMFSKNIYQESYFHDILDSTVSNGFFEQEYRGDEYFVNYIRYESPQIIFFNLSPKKYFAQYFSFVWKFVIFLLIIVICISISASYAMSRIFYAPITSLKSEIQGFISPPQSSKKEYRDEFSIFTSAFSTLKSNINELEDFRRNTIEYIKDQYLVHLLTDQIEDKENIAHNFQRYQINIDIHNTLFLFLIKIDQYNRVLQKKKPEEIPLLLHNITAIINDTVKDFLRNEIVFLNKTFVSLSSIQSEKYRGYDTFLESFLPIVKALQDSTNEALGISVSVTLSPLFHTIEHAHTIYQKTDALSEYRLVYGHQSILTPNNQVQINHDYFQFPVKEIQRLLAAIIGNDRKQTNLLCRTLITHLTQFSIHDIQFGLSYISFSIIETVNKIIRNSQLDYDTDFTSFHDEVNALETLEEIESFYITTLENFMDISAQAKSNRSLEIIKKIKGIVETNYRDKNLSVHVISDTLNLSPKYVNSLFKKQTSISIAQYINDYRISIASNMLLETKKTIEEIINQIGWGNHKYFYSYFKKQTGVTPNIYRMSR